MKFLLFFIILHLKYSAVSVETVTSKKLANSFAEIFGKEWENEKETEKTKLKKLSKEQKNGIQTEHENNKLSKNERRKGEIIQKFLAIKEKIKQKGRKYPQNQLNKINSIIARKLGTNRTEIYNWKKEFGMSRKRIINDNEKIKILEEFDSIVEEFKQKGKHSTKEWNQIYAKIAKKFGIGYGSISRWKREIEMSRIKINNANHRFEILKEFDAIVTKLKQKGKHSRKEWQQIYAKIAKKIGISFTSISRWKKKYGMSKKMHTDEEKKELLKKYLKKKKQNPKMSEAKIAKMLKINRQTLINWKGRF